jgi:hypothetical protein
MISGDDHRSISSAASACNVSGFTEVPANVRPLPAAGKGLTVRLSDESSRVYLSSVSESWEQTAAALDQAEASGKKAHIFLRRHVMLKPIVLPRQARDKHRKSTQNESDACFLQSVATSRRTASMPPQSGQSVQR